MDSKPQASRPKALPQEGAQSDASKLHDDFERSSQQEAREELRALSSGLEAMQATLSSKGLPPKDLLAMGR